MNNYIRRIKTNIFSDTAPIIGAYIVESGSLCIGKDVYTKDGKYVGKIVKILGGNIMDGHTYVTTAKIGDRICLSIDSNMSYDKDLIC